MPQPSLHHLLRLLDDETPAVRESVQRVLADYNGDLSEQLPDLGIDLSAHERALLSRMLHPGRRRRLRTEWVVPSGGWPALGDDWDRVEALLRMLSDYLHDGLTLRLPVPDALDLLAEEFELSGLAQDPDELRRWLFADGRFRGDEADFHAPHNSDLSWILANGRSNPIGLSLVFMLCGRRLGIEVEGCSFPGRFLCRIVADGQTRIVDCFDRGHSHDLDALLRRSDLSDSARRTLEFPAPAGAILVRVLHNLHRAFRELEYEADASLITELLASLEEEP